MNEFLDLINEMNNMNFNFKKGFPLDVLEEKDGYKVIADIPGYNKEDIKISFNNGELTIETDAIENTDKKYLLKERNNYALERTISFDKANIGTIKANYENGVLTVFLEKVEKEKKNIVIE